ncbi:MAG: hypothetical protein FWD40_06965 [Treponema sp.]|nr:hypothetical protein [Treponema sp.]
MNSRAISKIGFLLVIIGCFMPMFSITLFFRPIQMNGFEYASAAFELGSAIHGILMYLSFASAIIGLIIGILLLVKKGVPIIIDWAAIIVCFGIIIFLSIDGVTGGATLQSGIYLIIFGLVIALIGQIISITKKDN